MELLQLETFALLVQYQNFSQVAKKLNVSQPTVTVRIKALEEQLNMALVIRVGRKVKITPAGQSFYDSIERSLRVLRDGIEQLHDRKDFDRKKRCTLVGPSTVCYYMLPQIIARFYQECNMELSWYTNHSKQITEMLIDKVADIGFIHYKYDHPDLKSFKLYEEVFYLVSLPSHPFTNLSEITISDLKDEPLVTYKKGTNMYHRVESLFREHGIQSNTKMELKNVNIIKKMVKEGNGIAFLPQVAIEKEIKSGHLSVLPLKLNKPMTRDVHVVFHRKNMHTPAVRSFLRVLNEYRHRNLIPSLTIPR